MHPVFVPKRVVVEKTKIDAPVVANIMKNVPGIEVEMVERMPISPLYDPGSIEIVDFKGDLLRACPGTRRYICCGYKILHFGLQCSVGCTYCILQAYYNTPNLRLFANWTQMCEDVRNKVSMNPDVFFRVGTGEFTDSLLLDPYTEFSSVIVPLFSEFQNAILELKTKTHHIKNLEKQPHCGRTIVSWSMNSLPVVRKEEGFAVSIEQRLQAAKTCESWGYRLGFHFDPIIFYQGWEEDYKLIVDKIFKTLGSSRIVWISLGCFRFMPSLKSFIQSKYPRSSIVYGEFVPGLDGKMRYFKKIRVEIYRKMYRWISSYNPGVCVYLCMEGRDVWKEALGFTPEEKGGLSAMLDGAAKEKCGMD